MNANPGDGNRLPLPPKPAGWIYREEIHRRGA
jgi:hypothetical protein